MDPTLRGRTTRGVHTGRTRSVERHEGQTSRTREGKRGWYTGRESVPGTPVGGTDVEDPRLAPGRERGTVLPRLRGRGVQAHPRRMVGRLLRVRLQVGPPGVVSPPRLVLGRVGGVGRVEGVGRVTGGVGNSRWVPVTPGPGPGPGPLQAPPRVVGTPQGVPPTSPG